LAVLGGVLSASLPLDGQNVELQSPNPDLPALNEERKALQEFGLGPFDFANQLTSPDAAALGLLNDAASSGASELRAIIDLLACTTI
jgi:hypothetical protein